MIISGCPQNLPVVILFKLNVLTEEFEDHVLVHDVNVKGVVGKLYISTQDRNTYYLDLEKAMIKMDKDLGTVEKLSQYILTGINR